MKIIVSIPAFSTRCSSLAMKLSNASYVIFGCGLVIVIGVSRLSMFHCSSDMSRLKSHILIIGMAPHVLALRSMFSTWSQFAPWLPYSFPSEYSCLAMRSPVGVRLAKPWV